MTKERAEYIMECTKEWEACETGEEYGEWALRHGQRLLEIIEGQEKALGKMEAEREGMQAVLGALGKS